MIMGLRLLRPTLSSYLVIAGVLLLSGLLAAACGNQIRPAPERPTQAVTISQTLQAPDNTAGQAVFTSQHCVACHGEQALGKIGPALARTALPFDTFLIKVRTALPPKPAYSAEELSDQQAYDIYGWLQSLSGQGAPPTQRLVVVKIEPGQEDLPPGEILGMSVWTGMECSQCHGAFAQGSKDGPALAGLSFPYELVRATMRQTADTIPQHDQSFMRDTVLKRLYEWLKTGADPEGGC